MLELNIIGNNAVGRMYRPDRINSSKKRGYIFYTKYKSNYGGDVKRLLVEINLETNTKDNSELIRVDIIDDKIKTGVRKDLFTSINKRKAKSTQSNVKINGFRRFVKPDHYNVTKKDVPAVIKNDKGIVYVDMFIDSDFESEKELISFAVYPSVVENEEVMVFECKSTTPIVVNNDNGVVLI